MDTLNLALIQMRSGRRIRANVEAALASIEEAARGGAKLIATPEMTTLLERDRDAFRREMVAHDAETVAETFAEAAQRHGVHLLIGSMPVPAADGKFFNRSYLFGPDGTQVATYDKIHLFDVQVDAANQWTESALYRPGDWAVLADTGYYKLGLSVCYDLRFAQLFRRLAQAGAQILTVPSAFTRPTGEAHWHVLLRARAIETGSFVIAPAQGGLHEDGRETYGHSLVVNPWGEIIAEANHASAVCLHAVIELEQVNEARARIPSLLNERAIQLKRD